MSEPKKMNIANIPTPIQKIEFNGTQFLIKRDDLTGSLLSGNKIRKLDYILADVKKKKADYLFTCGGDQSNHARATVIAAKQIGVKTKLFLWGSDTKNADGNLFLDKLTGAIIKFLSKKEYNNVIQIMLKESKRLQKKGNKVYVLPAGGSTPIGIWGYINFMRELSEQIDMKKVKGILSAAGSGGTSAGMLLGAAMLGLNLKIYGVNVVDDGETTRNVIIELVEDCIKDFNLKVKVDFNNLIILDGYSAEGYKSIADNKLKLIKEFFRSSGILLDPAYTGKAFYAYHENFLKGEKKSNIMFLHTGGIFGIFSKRRKYLGV
ncbi:pyridoxal phosphate-dependent deaminase, putative [hydrothermal vent metagenome]|uniref:Pyridoxal phosphate-dependent deaminase, putative n=1 Tax=hydrothermal vent metagenome TaxID=652676 RepID=A0A3B1CM21_9ZZZZ